MELNENGEVRDWRHIPRLLPDLYAQGASELASAIAALEAWKVPVPQNSRLRVAVATLLAGVSSYPSELTAQRELWSSLVIAVNFTAIARTLPSNPVRSLRGDLREAVEGVLLPISGARRAQQLESQHLVGAALHLAGVSFVHAPIRANQPKNPDFVLSIDNSEYGVEVKRPEGHAGIVANLDKAIEQLTARNTFGLIAIDVTDVLTGSDPSEAQRTVMRIRDDLGRLVAAGKLTQLPGYDHVGIVYLFARFPHIRTIDDKTMLVVEHIGAAASFEEGTLATAERIRDQLTIGLLKTIEGW